MCKIYEIHYLHYPHDKEQLIRCQASFKNANAIARRNKKKRWLRRMFSSFSRRQEGCSYKIIHQSQEGMCYSCFVHQPNRDKDDHKHQTDDAYDAYDAADAGDADEKSRQTYIQYQEEERAKMEEQHKRFNFQCSTCASEGRNMDPGERGNPAINRGLCCARGLDEYEAQKETEGKYEMHQLPQSGPSSVTDGVAVSRSLLHNPPRTPWPASRIERPRLKLSRGPPEVHRGDRGPPGPAGIKAPPLANYLGAPVIGRIASPGIMWDRWAQMIQTNHGRYPPPGCPPRKPLPPVPTDKAKGKQVQRRPSIRGPEYLHQQHPNRNSIPQLEALRISPFRISGFEEHTEVRCESDQPPPARYIPYRPDSQILVPQFPGARFTTTPSEGPARPLRSVASNLEEAIDGMVELWTKEGGGGGAPSSQGNRKDGHS